MLAPTCRFKLHGTQDHISTDEKLISKQSTLFETRFKSYHFPAGVNKEMKVTEKMTSIIPDLTLNLEGNTCHLILCLLRKMHIGLIIDVLRNKKGGLVIITEKQEHTHTK